MEILGIAMIIFIPSPMGSGKTLTLTLLGYLHYLNGERIYSNYKVNYPHVPIRKPEEIEKIKNGVFLGDELWAWLDSRSSPSKINKTISKILLKSRKRGYSIYHTAQFFMQPEKRLREHSDKIIVQSFNELTGRCTITFYNYMGSGRVSQPLKSLTFNGRLVFPLYDSYQGIYGDEEESPRGKKERRITVRNLPKSLLSKFDGVAASSTRI